MIDRSPKTSRSASAFTLLEVLLAVFIAAGMLALVLYFYHQAAATRTLILNENEHVTAARLLMERISSDLRTARPHEFLKIGFTGDTNSIDFLKTAFPDSSAWRSALDAVLRPPETDLHRVRYAMFTPANTNLGTVLGRAEEPFYGPAAVSDNQPIVSTPASLDSTNQTANPFVPLSDQFHFVSFRFFDGTNWQQAWSGPTLPAGVEVTLGLGQPPENSDPETYPYEIYRRTIFLPGSQTPLPEEPASSVSTNSASTNVVAPTPAEGQT